MTRVTVGALALLAASMLGCGASRAPEAMPEAATARASSDNPSLMGAWRSAITFEAGAFATIDGLAALYAFNAGGTMTESSNYDGAPPVPPAYGVWRQLGPRTYEAKYIFYAVKPPAAFDEIAAGGGWLPAGHGVFVETITLSGDGNTFESKIRYDAFDGSGAPTEVGSQAKGAGTRIGF